MNVVIYFRIHAMILKEPATLKSKVTVVDDRTDYRADILNTRRILCLQVAIWILRI